MKRILLLSVVLLVLVIPHIVSADTLLKYLDEDTADRCVYSPDGVFTTIWAGNGAGSMDGDYSMYRFAYLQGTSTSNEYRIYRGGYGFNTSLLPDDCTITSAKLGVYFSAKNNVLGNMSMGITGFTPTTVNSFVTADYQKKTNVRYATDILYNDLSTTAYTNFTWNEAGIANISKTGYSNFMLREVHDIDGSLTGITWASTGRNAIRAYDYIEDGPSKQPFFEITYTSGVSAPVASFTASKNFIRIPNLISVTDTSTNTPTSWEWSWGDGSANSTTQNPTHQYKKRGRFPIVLTATNAGGSGTTTAYNVRVAGYENV